MTERETLLAEIAERQARLAELDAEPDYEAWRPALEAFCIGQGGDAPNITLDKWDKATIRCLIAAFARHRHTATAEALEAMREAREALEHGSGYLIEDCGFEAGDEPAEQMHAALTRLTAAIAKIEGGQP